MSQFYEVMDFILKYILPIASFFGVGKIMVEQLKQNSQKAKNRRDDERKAYITEIVRAEIDKIQQKMMLLHQNDDIQRQAQQAILRDRLYSIYKEASANGFTTEDERENFINLYDKYHKLGQNGVMDMKKDLFFNLPTEEEHRKKLMIGK